MSEPLLSVVEDGGRREYRVPAAEKALDILEFMAAQREDVTPTELAGKLGRSIHELYRVMQLLERRGYLLRTLADRYRLSLKLFELAHRHPPINRLIDSALPVMRDLANRTDQSCHLAVLRDLRVLIVLQVESPLPMRYSVALGAQFPILETSSGAVLLARLPAPDRAALIERIIAADEAEATREEIEARLDAIVALGHEMRPSLAVAGCTNMSVPVRDHFGATIAALTVPYLPQKRARRPEHEVLRAARAAAQEISRALSAADEDEATREAQRDAATAMRPAALATEATTRTRRKE